MKKQLIYCLLIGLFVFGSSKSSFSEQLKLDVGEILLVVFKQGSSYNFLIPDQFVMENNLIMPVLLTIEKEGQVLYSQLSQNQNLFLPNLNLYKGQYKITVSIGNFQESKKVSW